MSTFTIGKKVRLITQAVSVGFLPAGMYIIQAIIDDRQQFTAKFIRL